MKLVDKIKDLFMDDVVEDDEVEVEEEIKEEYKEPSPPVLPKVMRENIEKEEDTKKDFITNKTKDEELPHKKFNFPIDISDELPTRKGNRETNINVLDIKKETTKRTVELYAKKEENKEKNKFKASPVISPVYGILDKNYSKDEVKERAEDVSIMKRPSKKVDFEMVRKKAFGNLVDEIKDNMMCENCSLYQEAKKNNPLNEDDLLYDMTVDNNEDVTLEKAYDDYKDFGVAYEPKGKHEIQENDKEIIINNTVDEEIKEDKEIKDDDKVKVDDDFFSLIDSMYKERSDE